MLHRLPFQCSISVRCTKLAVVELPTAQISLAAMAVTPARVFSVAPFTLGLATTLHCLPFQCSTSVELPLPLPYSPTAQRSLVETAAMLWRKLLPVPTLGLATLLHPPQFLGEDDRDAVLATAVLKSRIAAVTMR